MRRQNIVSLGVFLGIAMGIFFSSICEGNNVGWVGKHYTLKEAETKTIKRRVDENESLPLLHVYYKDENNKRVRDISLQYIRVRIDPVTIDESGWFLVIRDGAYRPLQTLIPSDFQTATGSYSKELWTDILAPTGNKQSVTDLRLRFDLIFTAAEANAEFEIHEYIIFPKEEHQPPLYSIYGSTPTWQPLYDSRVSSRVRRAGDSVAYLFIEKKWVCSGVVIATDPIENVAFLLTNLHCGYPPDFPRQDISNHWRAQLCTDMVITLSWHSGNSPRGEYKCEKSILTDINRDLAVLQIKAKDPARPLPIPPIIRSVDDINIQNEKFNIVHHPQGRPKSVSAGCKITNLHFVGWVLNSPEDLRFTYKKCDTDFGSSGAPVFDDGGNLIGLHNEGFYKNPPDRLNKAIRMDKIIAILKSQPKIKNGLREQ